MVQTNDQKALCTVSRSASKITRRYLPPISSTHSKRIIARSGCTLEPRDERGGEALARAWREVHPEAGLLHLDLHQHESPVLDDAVDAGIERTLGQQPEHAMHLLNDRRFELGRLHATAVEPVDAELPRRGDTTQPVRKFAVEEHTGQLPGRDAGEELLHEHAIRRLVRARARERLALA